MPVIVIEPLLSYKSRGAPPQCSRCAFYIAGDKTCARVIVTLSKTEAYFETAQVVRLRTAESVCGPMGNGFVEM